MVFMDYNSKTNNRGIRTHGGNKVHVGRYINDIQLIICIYIYKVLITSKFQNSRFDRCRGRVCNFEFWYSIKE